MVDRPRAWRSPPPIPQPIPGVIPTRPRDVMPAIPPPPLVPSGPYREPAGESLEARVEALERTVDELLVTRTMNRATGWLAFIILIAIAAYEVLR